MPNTICWTARRSWAVWRASARRASGIYESLERQKASGKATMQLSSLLKNEFLVGVRILQSSAAHLIIWAPFMALQEKSLDSTSALNECVMAVAVLNDIRMNAKIEFKQLLYIMIIS